MPARSALQAASHSATSDHCATDACTCICIFSLSSLNNAIPVRIGILQVPKTSDVRITNQQWHTCVPHQASRPDAALAASGSTHEDVDRLVHAGAGSSEKPVRQT
ncbi:hypothetical protein IAQ61_008107 [Plenodomus lingam]|uniref:uncharacterized protein n=1 Tax=Leptosphaeria maculans TaxID=5022 RepID=UPI00332C520D|nr:hypothetical protein IAQ61_008107 [Plenodomus lingam]